ncbi:MAG: type VI secretion system accessory protein TagJ [Maricaulaceae bacterium]
MASDDLAAFQSGDASGWINALTQAVKASAADPVKAAATRVRLGEGLMTVGDLDRADTQFDTAVSLDPSWGPKAALLRQLLRALKSRDEVFAQGRAPEVLAEPDAYLTALLKANAALRDGEADAGALFEAAEQLRPAFAGVCDGATIDDWRDLDDRLGGVIEVVTSNGKYFWTPMSQVRELRFQPIERPRDVVLRQMELDVIDGPTGVVFMPTTYWTAPDRANDAMRLARVTEWSEGADSDPVIGYGQRVFLVGEEAKPVNSLTVLTQS